MVDEILKEKIRRARLAGPKTVTDDATVAEMDAQGNLVVLQQGNNNIILNLTALDYLDSSGIGELVRNYLAVVKKGGAMKVVGLAPKVEEILKVTQLYQVFPEFPDEASALESFPERTRNAGAS